MKKTVLNSDKAPAAIGPYSQGIEVNGFIFLSGQIPLKPEDGEMVTGGIEEQTKRVMENIKAVLQSHDLTLENVIKTTIFMTDLAQFAVVNEIYGSYFQSTPPARSTIQVAALPKGAQIEIETIAVTG